MAPSPSPMHSASMSGSLTSSGTKVTCGPPTREK